MNNLGAAGFASAPWNRSLRSKRRRQFNRFAAESQRLGGNNFGNLRVVFRRRSSIISTFNLKPHLKGVQSPMAKSKEKKAHPKAPADVKTVVAINKLIDDRKAKLIKRTQAATKDGKVNTLDPKLRTAKKRLKRAQRKLLSEAYRLQPHKTGIKPPAPPAPAEPVAAAAEGEKKE
jgi:hypothetical protein